MRSISPAVTTMVVTALLSLSRVHAQAPETPSPAPAQERAPAVRQTLTVQSTVRRVHVGDVDIAEEAAPVTYRLVSRSATLRVGVTPVSFSALGTRIRGTTPFSVRLDYRLHERSEVRVYASTSSVPQTLTAIQTSALGAAGTPTLDIDSFALGTPALVGGRVSYDLDADAATTTIHGGVEYEPRPGGSDPGYWRGTTVRTGLSIAGGTGDTRVTGGFEITRSFADDLGRRNLFPGGGTINLTATGSGPLGEDTLSSWQCFGYYFRPVGPTRPDQPNRLIPVGDFMGVYSSISLAVGTLFLWPSIEISREASETTSRSAGVEERLKGNGWTTTLGTTVTVPAGRTVDVTPGAGYVFGSVGATLTSTTAGGGPPIATTDAFTDRIRGWWVSVELLSRF